MCGKALCLVHLPGRASLKTGTRTYPDVVCALLGRPGGLALELSIVLRCFGAPALLTAPVCCSQPPARAGLVCGPAQGDALCAGLLLVYEIVTGDILAGGGKGYRVRSLRSRAGAGACAPHVQPLGPSCGRAQGLLCDALGASGGWCANRPLILGVMTLAVFAPLVSLRCAAPT